MPTGVQSYTKQCRILEITNQTILGKYSNFGNKNSSFYVGNDKEKCLRVDSDWRKKIFRQLYLLSRNNLQFIGVYILIRVMFKLTDFH